MKSSLSSSYRSELAQQCVKCGLCLPHCPTYAIAQNEAESPRGRIALMLALAQSPDLLGSAEQPALNNCLGCRRCESACPAHVSYDELLIGTRAASKPALTWQAKLALLLMQHKAWLNSALALYRTLYPVLPAALKVLPKPDVKHQSTHVDASTKIRSALFSGCVADIYEQNVRLALQKLLGALGESIDMPSAQVCCGQAAVHAGDAHSAEQLAAKNRRAFATYDQLLTLASGCFSALEQSAGIPVIDASVYLQQHHKRVLFKPAQGMHIAFHTPCTANFHQQQYASLALLKQIPDLQITVLVDQGCCGAAGLHQLIQPERANQLRNPILEATQASGASLLLSQNIGCRLHFMNATELRVLHPLEFMAQFIDDSETPTHPA
jgi:glycolate oxidase iron-sulfur subunit